MKLVLIAILLLASSAMADSPNWASVQELLDASNQIRANPSILVPIFQNDFLAHMNCDTKIHSEWRLIFKEGCDGINEAITEAQNYASAGPLTLDEGLTKVSYEHSQYQISQNIMSHYGPQGQTPDVYRLSGRTQVNNLWRGRIRENIIDGAPVYKETAMMILAFFFLDDGVASRGHRTNMMQDDVNTAGFGIYPWVSGSKAKDRVTILYATSNSCCTACPFSTSQRNAFNWVGINSDTVNPSC
jgi:hypothetical protein